MYIVGNSWGLDPDSGDRCLGCGPQEEFYGCSDIAIYTTKSMSYGNDLTVNTIESMEIATNHSGHKSKHKHKWTTIDDGVQKDLSGDLNSNNVSERKTDVIDDIKTSKSNFGKKHHEHDSHNDENTRSAVLTARTTIIPEEEQSKRKMQKLKTKPSRRKYHKIYHLSQTDGTPKQCKEYLPTAPFKRIIGMKRWCSQVCPSKSCPRTHCRCKSRTIYSVSTYQFNYEDYRCRPVAKYRMIPGFSDYCRSRCKNKNGKCPKNICECI